MVGSGPSYCTASHAELILLEMSKTLAMRYTPAQFIHGPVEIIAGGFCGVLFDLDPEIHSDIDKVAGLLRSYEGKTIYITSRTDPVSGGAAEIFTIPYRNRYLAPILEILPIVLAAYNLGLGKNLEPGVLYRVHK
jgi:fructoselysine-6-P-deglycase FrlB-like protein